MRTFVHGVCTVRIHSPQQQQFSSSQHLNIFDNNMLCSEAYQPTQEIIDKVHHYYEVTAESVKQDVRVLREWIKQQRHFPQDVEDDYIEKCLVRSKFRVEETKAKLEKYYTLKSINCGDFIDVPLSLPSQYPDWVIPLPTLTDDQERIVIVKVNSDMVDKDVDILSFFKYTLCATEYSHRSDYIRGYHLVQDFDNFTFSHFKRYAGKIATYSKMYQEAYFAVVTGVEYLNVPTFMDVFMQACRALMKPKIYRKIRIHKNFESLHQHVDKRFLPKDYGGEGKTITEYLDIWDKEFEANKEYLTKAVLTEVSNEDLRVGEVKFNEIFGINGSFKTLNLD